MQSARSQYTYFENLEQTIKTALAIYIVLLICGVVLILGIDFIAVVLTQNGLATAIATGMTLLGAGYALYYFIGRVDWLGELHRHGRSLSEPRGQISN